MSRRPVEIPPMDAHNARLVQNVHPPDWTNPTPSGRYNLVVIGAGTAGLVCAAGAAGLGAKVALIERHLMGGDCLVTGCVPSKTLLHAARVAADLRKARGTEVAFTGDVNVDFTEVMTRVRAVRGAISQHDSAERFRKLGVDVFLGHAKFDSANTLDVEGTKLQFHRAVIASGARASVPRIPGLAECGYLTNETVFNLTHLPPRMLVIGGGPIGCELAQAFQRLGSAVTLVEAGPQILPREDADAATIVEDALRRDGVRIVYEATVERIEKGDAGSIAQVTGAAAQRAVESDAVLVCTGRVPNVEELGLDAAGVEFDPRSGVVVNDHLRTTNPRIFAAGDVCMQHKFTHAADAAARIVIQNALFGFLPKKRASALTIPWCTYTDPEVAHVGLNERDAQRRNIDIDTIRVEMKQIDRAITDDETAGLLKVHLARGSDRIAGATLVARGAGDIISELTVAMTNNIGLGKLANVIHPYPTRAEIVKRAADQYNRTRITPRVRRILEWILARQRK
ncbi:MAG: mercuric reductase [Candidatus Hydrogenedentes bacterium]|nr:mercuric reductase [Candidatus Hydrogenedentota bacterium]